jgi:hypothetical protein
MGRETLKPRLPIKRPTPTAEDLETRRRIQDRAKAAADLAAEYHSEGRIFPRKRARPD